MRTSWERLKHLQGINPITGVNQGYTDEFNNRPIYARLEFTPEVNQESLKKKPFRKYLEVFPPESHDLVITSQNYRAISRLDDLVDQVNSLADRSPFSIDSFRDIIQEMYALVYGRECSLKSREN